jgi:hypothetical protein
MYIKISKPGEKEKWIAVRGSSKLEGFHRWLNDLKAGSHMTPETAQALEEAFIGRWNHKSGVKNKGEHFYGTFDFGYAAENKTLMPGCINTLTDMDVGKLFGVV